MPPRTTSRGSAVFLSGTRRRRAGPRDGAVSPGPEAGRYARLASVRRDRGPGRPGQPTVLLLHGLGGDSSQPWAYLPDGTQYPRIAPDLRAHGGTGRIGPTAAFTFDGLADDVAALLDALNLAQPVLAVGVSMGAGIALNLALRYPARIAALALVRPAWLDQPMPPHLGAYPQIAALLRTAGPATGLARFKRAPSYRDVLARSPAAAASMRAQFTAPHAVTRAVRLDRMPHSVPYCDRAELRRLRQPALVIAARGDPTHPLAVAETTAAALPHASSRLVGSRDEDAAGQLAQIRTEVTGFLGRAVVPR